MVRIPTRYGFLASILGAALVGVLFYFGRHPFLIPVVFDFRIVLFALFLFFAVREFRDLSNGGVLFFWQGMITSGIFILSYSLTVSTAILILGHIEPTFVTEYIRQFTEQARSYPDVAIERIGKETFERSLKELQSTSVIDMSILYFTQCWTIGFFVSIILSVILRRQTTN